jgi:uncharacterized membrane protein
MTQSRWRSPVVWTAIVMQIIAIGQLTGIWAKFGIDTGMIGDTVAAVLQLLVIVGVLNNPENKTGF